MESATFFIKLEIIAAMAAPAIAYLSNWLPKSLLFAAIVFIWLMVWLLHMLG